MPYTVKLEPQVELDLEEAFLYYGHNAERFYKNAESIFDILEISPLAFQVRYDNIHCAPVNKFPYLIHYTVAQQLVIIYAILNTYKDPKKHYLKK